MIIKNPCISNHIEATCLNQKINYFSSFICISQSFINIFVAVIRKGEGIRPSEALATLSIWKEGAKFYQTESG